MSLKATTVKTGSEIDRAYSIQFNMSKPITITLPNGVTAAAVTRAVTSKRPAGWSKRSYGSYFNNFYGEQAKAIFDGMMTDGQPRILRYDSVKGVSNDSLYLRFQQGKMFLLQNMHTADGKYAKFADGIRCIRRKGVGIIIEHGGNEIPLNAVQVMPVASTPKWKKELDDYLENDNPTGVPFIRDNLALKEEDVVLLTQELEGLTNIMFDITQSSVRVIKGV